MQKFIRVTAIVVTAMMALSLILVLVSVPLQEEIVNHYYGNYGTSYSEYTVHLPIFPTIPFSIGVLRLVCAVALLFVCFSKKNSIRFEIIIFVFLLIMIPLIDYAYSSSWMSDTLAEYGADYYAANVLANGIAEDFLIFSNWGQAISYALCGMSVVYKRMKKETEVATV